MLTQPLSTIVGQKVFPAQQAVSDKFGAVAGLIASEFTYRKNEEIFGEDEPAEYVYEVVSGAVRSYKLLSDGRRQIGAFHLPGDVFGLESGTTHRLAAEAIIDTTMRLVKRNNLEKATRLDVRVARKLWAMTAGELSELQCNRRARLLRRAPDRAAQPPAPCATWMRKNLVRSRSSLDSTGRIKPRRSIF